MRTVTRILSTTLAGAALVGFTGLAGAGIASAAPVPAVVVLPTTQDADGEMHAESTRRFTITNLSGKDLRVRSVVTTWGNDPTPATGTVVHPGGELPVEVTWWFGWNQDVTVTFDVLDGQGRNAGSAGVTMTLGGSAQPSSSGRAGGGLTVRAAGYDVRFTNDAPTTIEIPASRAAEQSDIINRLVATGKVTVDFVQQGPRDDKAYSKPFIVGNDILINGSTEPATKTISHGTSQSESTSLGVSASITVAFGSLVEASLTTSLGHEWSSTEEFAASATVTAQPGHAAWVEAKNPVRRVTGDVKVTMGTTTWVLQQVSFDTPDVGRAALTIPRSRAMTADEIADLGPGLHMVSADVIGL